MLDNKDVPVIRQAIAVRYTEGSQRWCVETTVVDGDGLEDILQNPKLRATADVILLLSEPLTLGAILRWSLDGGKPDELPEGTSAVLPRGVTPRAWNALEINPRSRR